MIYFSTLFLALFVTMALTPLSRRLCTRIQAVDVPGGRKIHEYTTPKGGGLAMAVGAFAPVLIWAVPDPFVKAVLIGGAVALLFGFLDDVRPLGWRIKFAAQIAAALVAVFYGGVQIRDLGFLLPQGYLLPQAIAVPLTLLCIVGVTNAINLSDGLDGLAGGITLMSFCCIGYLAYLTGNLPVTLISIAVMGAILGFLRFNTFPATLFMGDAGSQFLGFVVICLALDLTQGHSPLSPLLPLLILGFPILDTLAVMVERISVGSSPFQADNRHFHHRLLGLGLYHTEAVTIIYVLQSTLVIAAYFLRFHSEWLILSSYLLFAVLVLAAFLAADKTGFRFKRYEVIDQVIKAKLKVLKDRAVVIRFTYVATRIVLPALVIAASMMAGPFPSYFSYAAFGLLLIVLLSLFMEEKGLSGATRLAFYLLVPAAIYLSTAAGAPQWLNGHFLRFYHLAFAVLALLVIFTLKFTRRQRGFKVSPLDFIILFLAVVVPNLPGLGIGPHYLGLVAVKVIILLFSYEVLLGEMRGRVRGVAVTTMIALAVFGVKGLL
jgi:UDP-GlcNAc:undecaprenyl-phosphate/decaprenyl-phosphate GlcNAc-1-phosphate transferase